MFKKVWRSSRCLHCDDYTSSDPFLNPDAYFSQDYFEARRRFREAAKEAGADEILSVRITGDDYTTDFAIFNEPIRNGPQPPLQ